jgi:hypothetical protein
MKNNNHNDIKKGRTNQLQRAASTDILVNLEVVELNQRRLAAQPKRKRRRDYAKKIMNDPFIFNV